MTTSSALDGEFIFMIGKNVDKGGGSPAHPGNICKAEYLEQAVPDSCGAGDEPVTGKEEFFGSPSTVFVDTAGHLWVGDKERVLEFDSEGAFIAEAAVPEGGGDVVARHRLRRDERRNQNPATST